MKVVDATNACPIVITTDVPHCVPITTAKKVIKVSGVLGNTAANGTWLATYYDQYRFHLSGTKGNGDFIDSPNSLVVCKINLFQGSADITLGAVTMVAAGAYSPRHADVAITLGAVTMSASGTFVAPVFSGTSAVTLGAVTMAASGTFSGCPAAGTTDCGSAAELAVGNNCTYDQAGNVDHFFHLAGLTSGTTYKVTVTDNSGATGILSVYRTCTKGVLSDLIVSNNGASPKCVEFILETAVYIQVSSTMGGANYTISIGTGSC